MEQMSARTVSQIWTILGLFLINTFTYKEAFAIRRN